MHKRQGGGEGGGVTIALTRCTSQHKRKSHLVGVEGGEAKEHDEHDHTQRPNIAVLRVLALDDLWGDIVSWDGR